MDEGVAGAVEENIITEKGSWRIGIVGKEEAYWLGATASLGSVVWVVGLEEKKGDEDVRGCLRGMDLRCENMEDGL